MKTAIEALTMRLISFKIYNYKSYIDTGTIDIADHMNVIVGQNNVGKTALLRALSQKFEPSPHRDSRLQLGQTPPSLSFIELAFSTTGEHLKNIAIDGGQQRRVPALAHWSTNANQYMEQFFAQHEITLAIRYSMDPSSAGWQTNTDTTVGLHHSKYDSNLVFNPHPPLRQLINSSVMDGYADNLTEAAASVLGQKTYLFDSHRTVRSFSPFGYGERLNSDASNLAEVLSVFQGNAAAYRRYLDLVRRVIPTVKWVSVRPFKNTSNHVEIMIWNVEAESEREDLANPLSECGTGVGQVLAILYVIVKSAGDIIIIDEPNSFLHPGATRMLVEIFRESKQHQFILSTHAPEIVSAARPERLFVLRIEDEQTKIALMNEQTIDDARQVLSELGSRLSDVFGYERVLWVEGPTEVQSFPILMGLIGMRSSTRVTFAQLRNTGDLKGKHAQVIADIYRNVSQAHAILPEPLAVLLDGDQRGSKRLEALEQAFPGLISFLPRWTFENYLVHINGITAVLNSLPGFSGNHTNTSVVKNWIDTNGSRPAYGAKQYPVLSDDWLQNVNATEMFSDMFQELSCAKEIHRKPLHTVALVRWIAENDAPHLAPLCELLRTLLPT